MFPRFDLRIVLILVYISFQLNAQTNSSSFETSKVNYLFFDRFGKEYNINELRIVNEHLSNAKSISSVSTTSCNAGYYNLYFETGSGMEGNTSIEISRRNVICQLFSDLSAFIGSPLNNFGNATRVNIWVRDIANMGVSNPSSNATLGLGSQFFCIPNLLNLSGIADNMVYQTILSGKDAYTNVANPLYTGTSNSGNFYHSAIAFNFSNSTFSWHTNLSQVAVSNSYDLYSVALHEFTHALGFGSLINGNGQSKFGSYYPYYTEYDLFLKTQTNIPLIINSTPTCSKYNYAFNSALDPAILQPGFTSTSSCIVDSTICSLAIYYTGSVTQPVYTPDCFAGGSSLSHFEDQCTVPATFTTTPSNNKYFVMSDTYNSGPWSMKRYLKPEERSVLCDLGYNVLTNYGSIANLTDFNYGGTLCAGLQVAGTNDGISNSGSYSYLGTLNTPIAINGILSNDFNAVSFECLEVIMGSGTLTSTSGTIADYTPNVTGAHLLRYIPVAANGNKGNITYVFVFVQSGNCNFNACDLISNGGFENGQNCGQLNHEFPIPLIDCWYNTNDLTPDYLVRGCIPQLSPAYTIPLPFVPPVDTWNYAPNNRAVGLFGGNQGFSEGIQCQLNSGMQPGESYVLSFFARTSGFSIPWGVNNSCFAMFAGSDSLLSSYNTPANLPPGLNILCTPYIIANNQWNYMSMVITNTTSTVFNYLTILNPAFTNTFVSSCYFLIDDISLKPINSVSTFSIPGIFCVNQSISDLSSYVSVPGGVFSGIGVSNSLGIYSFNPISSGTYNIIYTYTNNLGCSVDVVCQKTVNVCTNIKENENSYYTIQLFPNPGTGLFQCQVDNEIKNGEIIVMNSLGQTVYFNRINEGINNIDLSSLAKGLFHYMIYENNRLVKQGKFVLE
jgi:hypothetical protein